MKEQTKIEKVFGAGASRTSYMPELMERSFKVLAKQPDHHMHNVNSELTGIVAKQMKMTEEQLEIPGDATGKKSFFQKEIEFAWTYLSHLGLIYIPKRGQRKLTETAKNILHDSKIAGINRIIKNNGGRTAELDAKYKAYKKAERKQVIIDKLEAEAIDRKPGDQAKFRRSLIAEFNGTCVVTGLKDPDSSQACHIRDAYLGGSFDVTNGLFMRADIHGLYDRGKLLIDGNGTISTKKKHLEEFNGKQIQGLSKTTKELLDEKYQRFK